MNFDLAHFDIGVDDGVFADDETVCSGNRTLEVAVDAEGAGELEFAGDICSFVQKAGNLIGLLETKFHVEAPFRGVLQRELSSEFRTQQALVEPVHFFKGIEMKFDLSFASTLLNGDFGTER